VLRSDDHFYVCFILTRVRTGLPSCAHIRQVKKAWADATVARIQGTPAAKTYTASSLGNHGSKTSSHQYGLSMETVVQAHQAVCEEWHRWVLKRGAQQPAAQAIEQESKVGDYYEGDVAHAGSPVQNGTQDRQLPANFVKLRDIQRAALDTIMSAHANSQLQTRTNSVFVRIRGEGPQGGGGG
jgi:hypothetical protein